MRETSPSRSPHLPVSSRYPHVTRGHPVRRPVVVFVDCEGGGRDIYLYDTLGAHAVPEKVATPRVGVRALQSPARLVAESFAQGARLKGRMFKVQETTAVTKLVMPSSSEVSASTRCAFAGATYPLLT